MNIKPFIFALAATSAVSAAAQQATVRVEYTAPTTRTDGSELPPSEIASYEVRCGDASTTATTTVAELGLPPGTYDCSVRAEDTEGRASAWSDPVSITIEEPIAPPSAPANVNLTITVQVTIEGEQQ